MKKLLIIPFTSLCLFCVITSFEKAPISEVTITCEQNHPLAQNIWEKWGEWKPNIKLNTYKSKVLKLKSAWPDIVKKLENKNGPQFLNINGENDSGIIPGNLINTFVTSPSFKNKVTITINKYSGRASTDVTICTHSRSGLTNSIHNCTFAKSKETGVKTFVVNNARGKIISVGMANKSEGDIFTYRIKAK